MLLSRLHRVLLTLCCAAALLAGFPAAASPFETPPELERDVRFWVRIYSEVPTTGGLIHDDRNLAVVYEAISFPDGLDRSSRQRLVEQAKARYAAILRTLATGKREDLTADEARVLALWGEGATSETFTLAADRLRFQLGQSDRFREGLVRSGAWEPHLAQTLAAAGLPAELAALPHVESSFNPRAGSKVGAAGLWQFMPSTGRRFLRVDSVVDERFDPYRSTEAAAQYLALNYSLLGTWPLAITAYNHGAGGMRRAKELMGTDDIVTILRYYSSPSFGFASRNFFPSFLAALEVDRNYLQYFGDLERAPPDDSRIVRVPDYVPANSLARVLGVPRDTLADLNLALRSPVWQGKRAVPRGFDLRVPADQPAGDPMASLASLRPGERLDKQVRDAYHTVRRGDTLSEIAEKHGTTVAWLKRNNPSARAGKVRPGQVLKLPGAMPLVPVPAGTTLAAAAPARRVDEEASELLAEERQELAERPAAVIEGVEPVTTTQETEAGPALEPGVSGTASADVTDYSVAADGTIVAQGAETLGHYAEWLEVRAARLRDLNGIRAGQSLNLGRRLRLDLSRVGAAPFEQRRRGFHRALQDEFFSLYRITGTERYRVQAGDSLWSITQRRYGVPVWLLRQYNPELDLGAVRPGVELVIPRIEAVNGNNG